nr:hypothetical protein GCM10020185_03450 [Pseudomonas brassicacearum subsp. brassicacearum]
MSLELLETIQDPEGVRVAGELIYHYHPAVAWKAFQMLYRADPQNALSYVPSLKKTQGRPPGQFAPSTGAGGMNLETFVERLNTYDLQRDKTRIIADLRQLAKKTVVY